MIAVQLVESSFEGFNLIGAGFEQEQGFGCGFDLALPAVDGLDGGDDCGAGGEAFFDQRAGQSGCFFGSSGGRQDDLNWQGRVGHGAFAFVQLETLEVLTVPSRFVIWLALDLQRVGEILILAVLVGPTDAIDNENLARGVLFATRFEVFFQD